MPERRWVAVRKARVGRLTGHMRRVIPVIALMTFVAGPALAQAAATGQFLLRLEPTRAGFTLQNMTAEEARLAAQHSQYLVSLLHAGKLSLAAQVFDPKGLWGIVIVNAADGEAARSLLEGDPGVKGKMFRGEVIPLRVVLQKPVEAAAKAVAVDPKVLESYAGTYQSEQVPLRIKASVTDGKLYLQATDQPEFPLQPSGAARFEFPPAGVVIEFDSASSFTLKQGGRSIRFQKAPER